jgi:uncharacterized protein YjbJ (UPF0337 family)
LRSSTQRGRQDQGDRRGSSRCNRDLEAKGEIGNFYGEIQEKLGQIKEILGISGVISLHSKKIENLDGEIQEKLGHIQKVIGLR